MHEHDANQEWHQDRVERAVNQLRAQRPARFRHDGELLPELADWSSRLARGEAGNLLIVGSDVGTGKTWSMWEALERAVRSGYLGRIMFCSAATWRDAIAPPDVDRARLRLMRTVDMLVLDDLGSGRIGDWELEQLLGVVDDRWAAMLPTGITSNIEDLRSMLGERIASRLADGATAVIMRGEDRRRAR